MLTSLIIQNVVLIDSLTLNFSPGLNVFTGETGAGKSILLDALGLALGERSEAGLVRHGQNQASVTAEFALPSGHEAFTLAHEHGLEIETPLLLRRVIGKDGKSRAFLNDQPISIGLLKQFGQSLLEIHGQFETHGLLNTATHLGLLDSAANLVDLRAKTAATYQKWKAAEEQLRTSETERTRAAAEEDYLRTSLDELVTLAPEPDEADKLAERRTSLQHREKIAEALLSAEHALNGEKGAIAALTLAGKAIARIADKAAPLKELLATIDRASDETAEAASQLEHFAATIDAEPDALQTIEERLFALRGLARKHNVTIDALPALREQLDKRLALLTDQGDHVTALRKLCLTARNSYVTLAEELSSKRKVAASKLEKSVSKELAPLKLESAKFSVEILDLPEAHWSAEGMNRVTFLATTNVGSAPGALHKIASGGELSRFMLALKVVLAASDPVPTLVFDEVDSGIGGATASAVGERLETLAKLVQILVITHSPQVASKGQLHMRVRKHVKAKQTFTLVERLDAEAQREEIARMLSGIR